MTSEFSPSDRKHDSVDTLLGGITGGDFVDNLAAAEVSDHWIDEALRAVPLPAGFLTRMSRLAQSVQSEARSGNPA